MLERILTGVTTAQRFVFGACSEGVCFFWEGGAGGGEGEGRLREFLCQLVNECSVVFFALGGLLVNFAFVYT